MNKLKERLRENSRYLLIFGIVLIVLTIGLTFWLEDFVRSTILRPLAYLVWMFDLILSTLPERWYFTFVTIVVVLIATGAFRHRQTRGMWNNRRQVGLTPHAGPVSIWESRLHNLEKGRYANAVFAEQLSQILIRLLMTQNRMSQRELIRACEQETLLIPDYVRTFLLETIHHNTYGKARASWRERIWNDIKSFFIKTETIQTENRTIDLEPILAYMEHELNLAHQG